MNGNDFVEAVNEGKTLYDKKSGITIEKTFGSRIFLSTPQNAIFTSGDAVEVSRFDSQECVLTDRGEYVLFINPACFEIQED